MKKVLIIHGPNLNMLGYRPKEHYGDLTLNQINQLISKENDSYFELEFFQSNSEGQIITKIQDSLDFYAIIINPAAYTHTSVGIRDALEIFKGIKIEVHLSCVDERDEFRKINYIRDVCDICFSGKKENSYLDAIKYLKKIK
ncbi:MAG: 3-dehydroquinate dehydratase [Anaeroplasmataceae bacterium]|nr:3-dehydroquinate dehydratase [Anaeroplasmataceae bacterium]